ncbi:hypothetical protein L8T13_13920 [Enterobacter roggenkampii]|uniref:hypothetical protein n=1 Tax=Enterobacter roggenkampii TaxID=1812935 RepID=UPI000CCBFB0C|nr:hypothetical protein [Enterobacter roggenkampii]MCK6950516.1 hypothetical protein [Enterobacter roggenkampii]HDC4459168.1 hypothetical protein [Enterobacter asburiae]
MSNKTGGRAFPCDSIVERDEVGHLHGFEVSSGGMTLRDYFAAKAMQAFITGAMSDGTAFNPKSGDHDTAAEVAYLIADAMLCAREAS